MQILVLCDDHWHPARVPRAGLKGLEDEGFSFDWIEDARDWSAQQMASYPLVILTKSNHISSSDQNGWMTDEVQSAFAEYVHGGNGLLAIHSGTVGYEQMPVLRSLLGGIFTQHPEQCPVTMQPSAAHPFTEGIAPFTLKDEHYFMTVDDSHADVFMTTRSEHGEQPGGWRRMEGIGRVVVLSPGHNLEVWLHPDFQKLLFNSLRWCGKLSQ